MITRLSWVFHIKGFDQGNMVGDPKVEVAQWLDLFIPAGRWEAFADAKFKGCGQTVWRSELNGLNRYVAPFCSSTMDLAWDLERQKRFPEKSWVIAGFQTAGRGQLRREWVSLLGNLFATIRLPGRANALGQLLTFGVALVVVAALDEIGVPAEIKWPNDILVGRTKVGGILIEERQNTVLAGLGLNLKETPDPNRGGRDFRLSAGSVSDFGREVEVPELWNLIGPTLDKRLIRWLAEPGCIIELTESSLAYRGEAVVIKKNTGGFNGPAKILGLGSQGGLRVETAFGEQMLRSGQITPQVI